MRIFANANTNDSSYEWLIALITFVTVISFVIFLVVLNVTRNNKYKKFVLNHSLAYKQLLEINKKYIFREINRSLFYLEHYYDNYDFWDMITPKDFLTYELFYNQNQYRHALEDVLVNQRMLGRYWGEIKKECKLGCYDSTDVPKNEKKLSSIEKELFVKSALDPMVNLEIKVVLYLTNINGVVKTYKEETFRDVVINKIISDVNDRKGFYFNNVNVWNSICRVERGKVTNKLRFALYRRDNYRCRKCGRRSDNLEIDHIIPISKGGKSTPDNLQCLCHRCNVEKGTDTIKY